jgi:hypothetical protein
MSNRLPSKHAPEAGGATAEPPTDDGHTPKQYRVRAECAFDIVALQVVLLSIGGGNLRSFAWLNAGPFDVEGCFVVKSLDLSHMRDACRCVQDGHVMVQTVQPFGLYTGERDLTIKDEPENPDFFGRILAKRLDLSFVSAHREGGAQ